jgi:hypothetical protein
MYGTTLGLGVQGILNFVPSGLEPVYGSRTPIGGLVFVRLRSFHVRSSKEGMQGM